MLDTPQWDTIRDLVAWLDHQNGRAPHEIAMRLMKITEEAGEVTSAYIGVTGQNPRKGITHTWDDVSNELCDVILTAAVALATISPTPAADLKATLDRVARNPQVETAVHWLEDQAARDIEQAGHLRRQVVIELPVASPCAECDHPRDHHREGDDPVSPGQCTTCDTENPDDSWHDYVMATEVLVSSEKYTVTCVPEDARGATGFALTVRHRGNDQWTIQHGERTYLAPDGSWTSSDEHRFQLDTALRLAREAAPHITVNDRTVNQALARQRRQP